MARTRKERFALPQAGVWHTPDTKNRLLHAHENIISATKKVNYRGANRGKQNIFTKIYFLSGLFVLLEINRANLTVLIVEFYGFYQS